MHKRILVSYATGSGSTGEVGRAIGDVLSQSGIPVDVIAAQLVKSVLGYSAVVLGSSIRLGRWLPEAVTFLDKFKGDLQNLPVAYFTTCLTMVDDSEESRRTVLTYLEPVRQLAPKIEPVGLGLFAGSLAPEQQFVRVPISIGPIGDYRDWTAISAWAEAIRPAILAGEVVGEQRPFNLGKVILSFSDLSGTDLSRSNLWQADLQETRLRAANLRGANLRETDLTKADLRQADLHEAGLGWADLSQSNLSDANLRRANLIGAILKKADLSRADLQQATLNGANLKGAKLYQARLNQADLNWANLSDTDLREADFSRANLGWVDLSGAELDQAVLDKALYNEQTKWPENFVVEESGCIFVSQSS
jgi:menaquinone-dependent protoporphyrinogen oxidase